MQKSIFFLGFSLILFSACKSEPDGTDVVETSVETLNVNDDAVGVEELGYESVGEEIVPDNALSMAEMQEKYANLKVGDTLDVKYASIVNEVCQSKGCWMKLENGEKEDVRVKFKDYAFFVPKDIAKKEVVVSGKAYVTEVSVEEQRHYAEDAGKSPEEVSEITEPKKTLTFMADAVLIKK